MKCGIRRLRARRETPSTILSDLRQARRGHASVERNCADSAAPHRRPEDCLHTLGYYALALYAQGAEPAAGAGEANTDIVYLITHGGLVPQIVLVILLIFSAVSWGIVLSKFWQFRRSATQSSTFIEVF